MRRAIVRIFNPSVVKLSGDIIDIESLEIPKIEKELLQDFKTRILKYNYELCSEKKGITEYTSTKSKSWSLKVVVTENEISFTCPETKMFNSSLLFESFQTASELCDHDRLALLDCSRDKQWMNLAHLHR
ncbi:hypothetical protein HJP15_00345 [Pseudoalteromonas sp. NEC-BIFX-2020_002]|uniref:hypothetical protein n=1 Tax=Pseudoalteromonas sp. NEC-BIFX-2020_002 TaxID=2732353 RepID=UPI0014775676|nr:hypothetical protein [Pseudoalteromonas sp. NEC-BIFX-2020_002]NNG41400.1 hypothetical protein [Pseudoalteromonas sp. NEC-BIFX-2020_002]